MKVLHVAESFGSGVAAAVEAYVRSTPELDHVLLIHTRNGTGIGGKSSLSERRSYVLPSQLPRAVHQIRKVAAEERPDVVHAHSSIGGGLVRIAIPKHRCAIVYTPHCYSFERQSVSALTNRISFRAEQLLSLNTTVIAACSSREAELAKTVNATVPTVCVPNVVGYRNISSIGLDGSQRHSEEVNNLKPRVIAVGRFSKQKDPAFFQSVAREAYRRDLNAEFIWIGDWDTSKLPLDTPNLSYTGWLTQARALEVVASSDLYLHTALWEGFPMSILEASKLEIPIVARTIPALIGAPLRQLAADPHSAVDAVLRLLSSKDERRVCSWEWREYLRDNNVEMQRRMLLSAYRMATCRTL